VGEDDPTKNYIKNVVVDCLCGQSRGKVGNFILKLSGNLACRKSVEIALWMALKVLMQMFITQWNCSTVSIFLTLCHQLSWCYDHRLCLFDIQYFAVSCFCFFIALNISEIACHGLGDGVGWVYPRPPLGAHPTPLL